MIFFTSDFFIGDLYEFNTNNCLQASRSTKFCVFFNTKVQRALTCVAVLTPDSLIVKYFMTLCIPDLKKKIFFQSDLNYKKKIYKKKNHDFFHPWSFSTHGILDVIVSDNSTGFVSEEFQDFCQHSRTSLWNCKRRSKAHTWR